MIPETTADGDHLAGNSQTSEAVEDMLYTAGGSDPVADDVGGSGLTPMELAGIAALIVLLMVLWGRS